jgi:hypothetical protein
VSRAHRKEVAMATVRKNLSKRCGSMRGILGDAWLTPGRMCTASDDSVGFRLRSHEEG